jgi:hypothetical protein
MKNTTPHFLAFSLLVLLASAGPPAFGQCSQTYTCRSNGHTVALSNTSPLQGVNWPFSEDITGPTTTPVADNVAVTQAGFVRIASGCVNTNEINVAALAPFHGSFRVQTAIVGSTATNNSRFQIQLRLFSTTNSTTTILLDETRRLHGLYPQSDHFGVIKPDLAAGTYVYSVWVKLLASGSITFSNTWSTAQGYPASVVDAGASTAPSDVTVNTNWTNVGPSLPLSNPAAVDLILGSHWQIVSPTTAPGLQIRYAVDGIGPSSQFGQIGVPAAAGQPEGYAAFDALQNVAAGAHTLQLQMRTTNFTATIRGATLEYVAPLRTLVNPPSWPMQTSIASNTVHVSQVGSATQPMTGLMLDGCGKWTLLQEFDVSPHNGDYVWIFQVFTQFLGNLTGSARGQLAIENISYQLDANGNPFPHVSVDNAITGFQAPAGKDGMYSFGEAYRWGNGAGGNKIRLWVRRISGCGSTNTGGFDIGKRYVTVKLLPSDGCYPQ